MAEEWGTRLDMGAAAAAVQQGAVDGLKAAAELVLTRAQVPVLSGRLRRSGKVTVDPATLEVAISFDTDYAVVQHEDMSQHHDGGEAKFLENAINELRPVLGDVIAAEIRRRLGT